MRKIAAFKFQINSGSEHYQGIDKLIQHWISQKGTKEESENENNFRFNYNADLGKLDNQTFSSKAGEVKKYTLTEPKEHMRLKTSIELSKLENGKVFFYVEIAQENLNPGIPQRLIIKKPRLIELILNDYGDILKGVPRKEYDLKGEEGLKQYLKFFLDEKRHYPMIVISENKEHPHLADKLLNTLTFDLKATAFVCKIDSSISWKISETAGSPWSCYNGGIRIFWTNPKKYSNPYGHPLFSFDRLRKMGTTEDKVVLAVSNELRRRLIMDLSPYTTHKPEENLRIEREHSKEKLEARIKKIRGTAKDAEVYEELMREYEDQLEKYKAQLTDRENEIYTLKYELEELSQKQVTDKIEKAEQTDFESVEKAVGAAKSAFGDLLLFSKDVDKSIETLGPKAGPPEKIFEYFERLDQLGNELIDNRGEGIGKTLVQWLTENGVKCSGESETVKNSSKERDRRTFAFEDGNHLLEKHLKLGDATDIKHCVRIYFDWDSDLNVFRIGYVGKHFE